MSDMLQQVYVCLTTDEFFNNELLAIFESEEEAVKFSNDASVWDIETKVWIVKMSVYPDYTTYGAAQGSY